MGTVADERASADAMHELQHVAEAMQSQVTALQGVLATKVDRAEMLGLKQVAAELSSFQGFKSAATHDIRELGAKADDHRAAIGRSNDMLAKLSGVLQELAARVETKADGEALGRTDAGLADVRVALASKASADEARRLDAAAAAAAARLDQLEQGAVAAARTAADDRRAAEARVVAAAASVRGEFSGVADALRADLAALRDEVDARAYVTSLEATDEGVAGLRTATDLLGRKVEVALRFVDWYSQKGESYEANAASLERQMNALAVGNRARVVDTVAEMRARVFGTGPDAGARAAAYQPLAAADGGAVNLAGQFASAAAAAAAGPTTGTAGVRIGGVAPAPAAAEAGGPARR
jgi:hypothetical protein